MANKFVFKKKIKKELNNVDKLSILITGATGTFGKKFVEYLLKNYKNQILIIFSRD